MIIAEQVVDKDLVILFKGSYRDSLDKMVELAEEREKRGYMLVNESSRYNEFANADGHYSIMYLANGMININ